MKKKQKNKLKVDKKKCNKSSSEDSKSEFDKSSDEEGFVKSIHIRDINNCIHIDIDKDSIKNGDN